MDKIKQFIIDRKTLITKFAAVMVAMYMLVWVMSVVSNGDGKLPEAPGFSNTSTEKVSGFWNSVKVLGGATVSSHEVIVKSSWLAPWQGRRYFSQVGGKWMVYKSGSWTYDSAEAARWGLESPSW